MEQINALNFAPFPRKGVLAARKTRISLEKMRDRTGASHVIFTPAGVQETAHSEHIDFTGPGSADDEELVAIIHYAQTLGLKVILKPTVNCQDRTWRAFINFFDYESPPEPKWRNWFASHERFQVHYAALAEQTHCVMFIAGCEMVMAQRRDAEWRALIANVKQVYSGPVSYNTDKYQESEVSWWDCVDVISSSGYYPSASWEQELDRIEAVVQRFNKPFFFAEIGTMSTRGSHSIPNDWAHQGVADAQDQADWYREMFEHTRRRPWVEGYGLWAWSADLYDADQARDNGGYDLYAKPAEQTVRDFFLT
ncbi:MAG: hypothetical protein LBS86_06840 [Treponema sp.]|nr:hypothetical protein [Treponema sp.]